MHGLENPGSGSLSAFQKLTAIAERVKNGEPYSHLEQALADAELLLFFVAREGVDVDAKIIETVVSAIRAPDQLNAEGESAFWISYRILADKVKPVTVSSIIATHGGRPTSYQSTWTLWRKGSIPFARLAVAMYSGLSVAVLVMTLAIQLYWSVGLSITNKLDRVVDEARKVGTQITTLQSSNTAERDNLRLQQTDLSYWALAHQEDLRQWNSVWSLVVPQKAPPIDPGLQSNVTTHRLELSKAGVTLRALGTYVLPLLMGLLGACAYVLRELAQDIKFVTFSREAAIRYRLRLALGMLAGIAVGFFLSPSALSVPTQGPSPGDAPVSSLGPLAMAFLAGYSVELLFAAMDRIVFAFSPDSRSRDWRPTRGADPGGHQRSTMPIADRKEQASIVSEIRTRDSLRT